MKGKHQNLLQPYTVRVCLLTKSVYYKRERLRERERHLKRLKAMIVTMLSHLFGLARIYLFLLSHCSQLHVACRLTGGGGGIKQKTFVLGALISDHCRWLLFSSLYFFISSNNKVRNSSISLLSSLFTLLFGCAVIQITNGDRVAYRIELFNCWRSRLLLCKCFPPSSSTILLSTWTL